MAKALYKGTVIAESDATIVVEGNQYFPPEDVNMQYLSISDTHTLCPWKGIASYYTVTVDGDANSDAAWTYPTPVEQAKQIKGYIAFWRGVTVEK
jgi:uncharacterized protein (DUF427 family)